MDGAMTVAELREKLASFPDFWQVEIAHFGTDQGIDLLDVAPQGKGFSVLRLLPSEGMVTDHEAQNCFEAGKEAGAMHEKERHVR